MNKKWGNIFDYIGWRGDIAIDADGFNAIDGLILSTFAYVSFPVGTSTEKKVFEQAVREIEKESFKDYFMGISIFRDDTLDLLQEAAKSRRFKNLLIHDIVEEYDEETQMQFAAMTFTLPDNTLFIAYRGTDSSLIGWKEDFNMGFINGTGAQIAAADYALNISEKYNMDLRLGGHSKGGNLAVWAAAHMPKEYKNIIRRVYNYDGPGFMDTFIESEEYISIRDRVISFVPESSIVGVLMGACDYLSITSSSKSVLQHNQFSWNVYGRHFDYVLERSASGKALEKKANKIIYSMSNEEREAYVENLFSVLVESEAKSIDDIENNILHHMVTTIPKLVKKLIN